MCWTTRKGLRGSCNICTVDFSACTRSSQISGVRQEEREKSHRSSMSDEQTGRTRDPEKTQIFLRAKEKKKLPDIRERCLPSDFVVPVLAVAGVMSDDDGGRISFYPSPHVGVGVSFFHCLKHASLPTLFFYLPPLLLMCHF